MPPRAGQQRHRDDERARWPGWTSSPCRLECSGVAAADVRRHWRRRCAASSARGAVQPVAVRPGGEEAARGRASTNAMLRTTTALTIVNAGNKENVLPGRAEATVNFRMLPGDSAEAVAEHVQSSRGAAEAAAEGAARCRRAVAGGADRQRAGYKLIERTVREVFPGTMVAPGLMLGGTDSRHFAGRVRPHLQASRPSAPSPKTCRASTAPTSASPAANWPTWSASTTGCCSSRRG